MESRNLALGNISKIPIGLNITEFLQVRENWKRSVHLTGQGLSGKNGKLGKNR